MNGYYLLYGIGARELEGEIVCACIDEVVVWLDPFCDLRYLDLLDLIPAARTCDCERLDLRSIAGKDCSIVM
ncbi:MAG: hypothetical protein JW986_11040 [Methanotrichaceae archaeon]|nr:hypothetical protein [Methanotrichaceae archaeon]